MTSMLLYNGRIRTLDRAHPSAEWLVISGNEISEIGSGALPENLSDTPRLDLKARVVTPAFCDAHVHLTWMATALLGPDLAATTDARDVVDHLKQWDGPGRGPGSEWIVGDGFDETTWRDKKLPHKSDLDEVSQQRPILIKRVCGHVGVLNSLGLKTVKEGRYTDTASGHIAEEDLWKLNDRLRPGAGGLFAILDRVASSLFAHGITAVHDVSSPEIWEALSRKAAEAEWRLRVTSSMPATQWQDAVQRYDSFKEENVGVRAVPGKDRLRMLGVKIFTDGSLGAHTALLSEAYADAPQSKGTALYQAHDLESLARQHHERGHQLMVHAIGDAALALALTALEKLSSNGNPLRHRLEHLEVTPPALVRRLARSGLWASVQPNFAGRWSGPGGMNEQRLGTTRLRHCNAYASLQKAGVPMGFGSDCMPLGPAFGLRSAVRHPVPGERLDWDEALGYYTQGARMLSFSEDGAGTLAPGRDADLVVWEGFDQLQAAGEPAVPSATRIVATMAAGSVVYGSLS